MAWTKYEPQRGFKGINGPRVRRSDKSNNPLILAVPAEMVEGWVRHDIYTNGTRVAVAPVPNGTHKVKSNGNSKRTRLLTLPKTWAGKFPLGTTPVNVARENGMIVIDTAA